MNLAYIPAAPTRAAVAFDASPAAPTSSAGVWEAGAGAIFAENEALAWLVELLGWPATPVAASSPAARRQPLGAGRRPAGGPDPPRRPDRPALATGLHPERALLDPIRRRVLDAEVVLVAEDERGHLTGEALRAALRTIRRRVRRRGLGRHHERRAWSTTWTASPTCARSSASGCTSTARTAERRWPRRACATAVPRHRARGQLHRRPAQVAVRPVRLLCPALPGSRAGPGRALAAGPATWSRRPGGLESGGPGRPPLPARPRPAVLVQPGHLRHRPLTGGDRADAEDGPGGCRRDPRLRPAEAGPRAGTVGAAVRAARLGRRATTPTGPSGLAQEGVILCLPTDWQGRTVLRLAFVNPATDPERVIEVLRTTTG